MKFALFAALVLAAPARANLSSRDIYQKAGPAVVLIIASSEDGTGELGTGSLIDEDGRVLTNAHVIFRESSGRPFDRVRVYFKPARVSGDPKTDLQSYVPAKVVKYDRALDLALLELEEAPPKAALLPFSDSDEVEPGEAVVAIGHPEQGGLWTLTQGVVSTTLADLGGVKGKNVFQTDASINRGNSGGPLIGKDGGLVGVNTSMARKAADGLTITSVNFAIKSNVAKSWLSDTRAKYAVVAGAAAAGGAAVAQAPAAPAPAAPAPAPAAPAAEAPSVAQAEPKAEAPKAPEAPKAEEAPKAAEAPKTAETAPAAPPAAAPPPPVAQVEAPKPAETPKTQPAPKAKMLTPAKPYKIEDLIAKEIAEMEDLEQEMRGEIEKRRGSLSR